MNPSPLTMDNRPLYLLYRVALTQALATDIMIRALCRCDRVKAEEIVCTWDWSQPVAIRQTIQLELELCALRGSPSGHSCPWWPDIHQKIDGIVANAWPHMKRDFFDYDPGDLETATPENIKGDMPDPTETYVL